MLPSHAHGQERCRYQIPYGECGGCIDLDLIDVETLQGQVVDPRGEPIPGDAMCVVWSPRVRVRVGKHARATAATVEVRMILPGNYD
jgi:hypothetical protein